MNNNHDQQDNCTSNGISYSEKTAFVVGFAALVIAFYPYKELAENISIQIFNWNTSVYNLFGVFLLMLFFATYLYGLNYIRYDFPLILSIKWLSYIEPLAHIIYMVAFVSPIFIIFLIIISSLTNIIPGSNQWILAASNITTVITAIISLYVGFRVYKNKKDDLINELSEERVRFSGETDFSKGSDYLTILNLYESIVASLESLLVPYLGISIRRIPTSKVIRLASDKKIISFQEGNVINDLRGIRNKIAHNQLPKGSEVNLVTLIQAQLILGRLEKIKQVAS
ncbi:MAG: hypothetical protein WC523_06060 [Patescibacteria group bacterium]|jgi:hypothetical protein